VRLTEQERARLVQILEATSDLVGMFNPDGIITYLNAAGRKLTGVPDSRTVTVPINQLQPEWARRLIEQEGRPAAKRYGLWHGETAVIGGDGKEIPVSQLIIAHRGVGDDIEFYSTIARDIRERKAYEARIEYLAHYDGLTRLPNRTLLRDRTEQAIAYARRFHRPAALLVIDVDRFRLVNETSSRAGDVLLCMIADRLRTAVRDGDTVARLGGDTFAVLAAELARPDDALSVARNIQEAMAAPFALEGHDVHATVSIGASTYPRDGEEFDLMLLNADAAMNRVKADGRNGFQFYAANMTREARERMELENELRGALAKNMLELHFQPQIALETARVTGVEVLMRWPHPAKGWISPEKFVPVAEECDLIHALGELALQQGCRQLKAWDRAGLPRLRLAVNVSARQFRSLGFAETVDRALGESGVDPNRLELELTESVLVRNEDEAIKILTRLKSLGVGISVDDFGTGYSSLSYLSRLPIDCLKIDRSFVQRVSMPGHDATIAQAIISLAHSLGLRVVAEGVETGEQLEFLRAHGCDEAQGNLLSPAVRADAIEALLGLGALAPAG
jgi:diguanylate cyclase (GGDEF)-like protein/PAS domain S-box-containing protein